MRQHKWVRAVSLSAIALAIAFVVAVPASGAEHGWEMRIEVARVIPNLNYQAFTGDGVPVAVRDESDTGFGLSVGYRYTDYVGVELGFLQSKPGVTLMTDFGLGGQPSWFSDDLSMRSCIAALAFHLTPNRAVDLYVSPMIASTSFGDLLYEIEVPGVGSEMLDIKVRDNLSWGIGLGIEVPLGSSPWRATSSIRYLDGVLSIDGDQGDFTDEIDFDSTVISAGIGYHF